MDLRFLKRLFCLHGAWYLAMTHEMSRAEQHRDMRDGKMKYICAKCGKSGWFDPYNAPINYVEN